MMANAQKIWCLLATATSLLAGCSVLIESDKKQCAKNSQCDAPYVCGGQGLCEIQTGCATTEDCKRDGAVCLNKMCKVPECKDSQDDCESGELCNTVLGSCVRASLATCKEKNTECAPYEGAPVCIKSEGLCSAEQCKTNAECVEQERSPTALCAGGGCEDPTWHCLGVRDPRKPANSSEEPVLRVKVLYAYMQAGESETRVRDLTWRVCQFGDPTCDDDTKLATKDVTYGEDNYLEIRGLKPGLNYKLQLQGFHPVKADTPLLSTEYLMYRTVVGTTVDPKPLLMFEDAVRQAIGALADIKVDTELGLLLMRIFDCTDTEVAGVQVASGTNTTGCMGDCPTAVFYQNLSNSPDPGATATNSAGRAGIVNLKPTGLNRITLTRAADNKKITSFAVTPRANWLTYVFFWPWDYGTAVD